MKWGILGFGKWGKKLAKSIDKNAVLVAVTSRNIEKTKNELIHHEMNVHACSTKEMLADKNIDIVAVAVPINDLFHNAKNAILAGKNVFIEKPGATNIHEIHELKNLARSTGLACYVNYIYSEDRALCFLARELRTKKITSIQLNWNKWGSFDNNIIDNLVSHQLSILLKLLKYPIEINDVDISENIFSANCKSAATNITINTNRVSKVDKSLKMLAETQNGTYEWEPGKITYKNTVIFTDTGDLLSRQIKKMESIIIDSNHDTNFSIVELVNNTISDIKKVHK